MVSRSAPGPSMVIGPEALLNSSWPCVRAIVAGAVPSSNSIVEGDASRSAQATAHRRVPGVRLSAVLVTMNGELGKTGGVGCVWNAPMSGTGESSGSPRWSV